MKAFHEVRTYDSNFMVWHSNYDNISFLAHWHKEIELIYIRSGSARISITNHIFTANEGDLIVCDSGDIHYSNSFNMDNSLDFIIFDTNIISPFYEYSHFSSPLITKEQLEEYNLTSSLHNLIYTLKNELANRDSYYEEIVESAIKDLWYRIKRKLPKGNLELQSRNNRSKMLYEFQQLLSYLDANYEDNITLEFAAKRMHFSDSHFSKVFKNLTGVNFVNYLNMIRIEHATSQIKDSGDRLTDIAFRCGFNNIRTFNRVFKEMTGVTPTEFSNLSDKDSINLGFYKRKSLEQQFVNNDSKTLIRNK
jgi:AraC-like DNA-binding protein